MQFARRAPLINKRVGGHVTYNNITNNAARLILSCINLGVLFVMLSCRCYVSSITVGGPLLCLSLT